MAERTLPDYVVRGDTDPLANADEGDRLQITNAKVTTTGDGLKELEVSGVCDVEIVETPTSTSPRSRTEPRQLRATATKEMSS